MNIQLIVMLLALGILPSIAMGASEEIQVYLDDHNKPREFGVETHINYVPSGRSSPEYAGEQPPFHVLRFTPEFSLGLTDSLEAGLYILSTKSGDDNVNIDGAKLRLKFIAPRPAKQDWFWGLNYELGRSSRRVSEQPFGSELKGILGRKVGRFLLAGNANVDWDFAGSPGLEVDLKIGYDLSKNWQVGIEHYAELGPINDLGNLSQQSQVLFGCVDWNSGKWDANFGIGQGLTSVSDDCVIKLRVGTTFGR